MKIKIILFMVFIVFIIYIAMRADETKSILNSSLTPQEISLVAKLNKVYEFKPCSDKIQRYYEINEKTKMKRTILIDMDFKKEETPCLNYIQTYVTASNLAFYKRDMGQSYEGEGVIIVLDDKMIEIEYGYSYSTGKSGISIFEGRKRISDIEE